MRISEKQINDLAKGSGKIHITLPKVVTVGFILEVPPSESGWVVNVPATAEYMICPYCDGSHLVVNEETEIE
jgi:hypothetical protein